MTSEKFKKNVENIIPILEVNDLDTSVHFYTYILEFELDWGGSEGETICSMSKDGHSIMLSETGNTAQSSWIWIGLEDYTLFETYIARGVKVSQEPRNYSWAYEMKFEDIDGNTLWLGTGPRMDLPFLDR